MEGPELARAAEGRAPVIVRFSATERAFHWSIALPTLVLLLSGLFLRFGWLQALMLGYDRRVGLRLHLLAGVAVLLLPVLVALLGDRRVLRRTGRALVQMDSADRRFLWDLPRWLRNDPDAGGEVGQFNGGQKLNTLVTGLSLLLATATGLFLWIFPPRSSLGAAVAFLHEVTTYILLPVVAGHLTMALVHPRTRESLRGILFGFVDAEWARRHHPRWYRDVAGKASGPDEGAGKTKPRRNTPSPGVSVGSCCDGT
ncbi:MAG TPA: cytochrome b/b6 domain-containing protein [Candidatus Methylomirabilis sp.]|nr:cytochrome b/b6 domain-containing protein [Candidatus Methylomirabilis sp.]